MATPPDEPAEASQLELGLYGSSLELPAPPEPMRARPVSEPFDSPEYLFETRWSGIRALASIASGQVRLHNRRLGDLTSRFPELQPLGTAATEQPILLDGEIVIVDERGHPEPDAPQRRLRVVDRQQIEALALEQPACYLASDVLFRGQRWLAGEPLQRRKRWLVEALHPAECLYLAEFFEAEGRALFQAAIDSDLEGIVAKPKDGVYAGGASGGWLSVSRARQELVIGGYSLQIAGDSRTIELLLGGYDPAGGFTFTTTAAPPTGERARNELFATLNSLQIDQPPFAKTPPFIACWVRPEVVVTVSFDRPDPRLGYPVLERVRLDVAPDECLLPVDGPEQPVAERPHVRPRLTMLTTLPLPLDELSAPRAGERPRLRLVDDRLSS